MSNFKIFVDADACPVVIKEILFKLAQRKQLMVTFIANHVLSIPKHPCLKFVQVMKGFDVADDEIVNRVHSGDLVITSDIPLAAEVIAKGALALSGRGELFTQENIGAKLNMRDFMDTMRSSGVMTGGAPPMSQADRKQFADHLDKIIAQQGL